MATGLHNLIQANKFIQMDNKLYGRVRALFATALAISVATLAVAATRDSNSAVWIRGVIATAIAAILVALAKQAHQGGRAAYQRMRLMSVVAPIAIVIIIALPRDGFPAWMKAEQAAVGGLLLAGAIMVGRKDVRQD
jgi:hypothetical protein